MSDFNLGTVTAYGYAKDKGYTGTEKEFAELMASYASVAESAAASAESAAASATTATTKAGEASTSASNAATSATTASTAATTATTKAGEASTSASTASTKASEATTAAATATTKAGEASTSATNAAGSATTASTAATTATTKASEAAASATAAAQSAASLVIDDTLTHAGQAADAKKTGDEIGDLKDGLSDVEAQVNAALVTDTASGAIASFSDGADNVPVKSLTVDIEPVQDLHGQANPYPAGGGKNLFEITATTQTINGVTFTVNSDGTVSLSGTATSNAVLVLGTVALNGGTAYILNGCPQGGSTSKYLLSFPGIGYDSGSGYNHTPSADITPNVAITIYSGQNVGGLVFKPMVRLASVSDATFAPYENICPISGHTSAVVTVSPTTDAQDGTSYTIDLEGTRYGGTLDATTGVLTVDRGYVSSTGGWGMASNGVLYIDRSATDGTATGTNFACNMYPFGTLVGSTVTAKAHPNTVCLQSLDGVRFLIYDPAYTSAQQFNDYLQNNPLQIIYALTTPLEVQLTAQDITTLKGQNNIWNDCGNTEVEYRADTKLYIQKVINS